MAAPQNTYNSNTALSLGNVPQGLDDNPELYTELLDVHDAIEQVLTASDDADAIFAAYIAKQRNTTTVSGDYTVVITDGTIEVDATAGDITVTMHPVAEGLGYRYDIKRIDLVTTNKVTLVGDGAELIDGRVGGINISTKSSYTVKTNNSSAWNII